MPIVNAKKKQCNVKLGCGKYKTLSTQFYDNATSKDGKSGICRECTKKKQKATAHKEICIVKKWLKETHHEMTYSKGSIFEGKTVKYTYCYGKTPLNDFASKISYNQ